MRYYTPSIGIICATYSRPNTVIRLLDLLNDQRCVDFRGISVCVVDDGSPYGKDYLPARFKEYNFRFKYIYRDRHPDDVSQVYSSRNMAAKEVGGDFILQLDDDVEFHPYFLNLIQSTAGMAQEEHWLWTPRISNNIDVDKDGHNAEHDWNRGVDGRWYDGRLFWAETHWESTDSSATLMPRRTWEAIGGYDLDYDGAMGEGDQDVAIRVQKLGANPGDVKVMLAPWFVNKADEETGSWRDKMISKRKRTKSNAELFAEKHLDRRHWTEV